MHLPKGASFVHSNTKSFATEIFLENNHRLVFGSGTKDPVCQESFIVLIVNSNSFMVIIERECKDYDFSTTTDS